MGHFPIIISVNVTAGFQESVVVVSCTGQNMWKLVMMTDFSFFYFFYWFLILLLFNRLLAAK